MVTMYDLKKGWGGYPSTKKEVKPEIGDLDHGVGEGKIYPTSSALYLLRGYHWSHS